MSDMGLPVGPLDDEDERGHLAEDAGLSDEQFRSATGDDGDAPPAAAALRGTPMPPD